MSRAGQRSSAPRDRSPRVRGAGLPVRRRLAGVRSAGNGRRLRRTGRPAPSRAPARAAVHADHEGGVGPRRAARRATKRSTSSATNAYETLRALSLRLYEFGAAFAHDCGVILADTKFEFGEIDDQIIVIDEMMTPDSSRYWPAEAYQVGGSPPSFDKQYVRDFMDAHGLGPRSSRAAHVARQRSRTPALGTARRTSSSPARASTTGSVPTTRERRTRPRTRDDRADGGSCRTWSLACRRSARQPAATADLPERASAQECRWQS